MAWGHFSIAHCVSLLAAAMLFAGLYFGLRKASERLQTVILGILSFSGIVALLHNWIRWGDLPLQLCSLTAMLLPILVFTKNDVIGNLLLLWSVGAGLALVYNTNTANAPIFGLAFNLYYFPHVMEFSIPWLMLLLGKVKKRLFCVGTTLGITVAVYTLVHFANLRLEATGASYYNYMYSMGPTTSLAKRLWDILPCRYWYMYLALPFLLVLLMAVYAPQWKAALKDRREKKAHLR